MFFELLDLTLGGRQYTILARQFKATDINLANNVTEIYESLEANTSDMAVSMVYPALDRILDHDYLWTMAEVGESATPSNPHSRLYSKHN